MPTCVHDCGQALAAARVERSKENLVPVSSSNMWVLGTELTSGLEASTFTHLVGPDTCRVALNEGENPDSIYTIHLFPHLLQLD